VVCVAPPRLAALARRARRSAGLLDITPSFDIKQLGPICLPASPRCAGSTDGQSAFADAP